MNRFLLLILGASLLIGCGSSPSGPGGSGGTAGTGGIAGTGGSGLGGGGGSGGGGLPPATAMRPELLMATGVRDVWGRSSDELFAVGEGLIARFDGDRWVPEELPDEARGEALNGVYGFAVNNVYVVGRRGLILHFDGTGWTVEASGTSRELFDVWGTGPSNLYASGSGVLVHFDGAAWTEVELDFGSGVDWRGVSGSGPNDVLLAGEGGNFQRAHFGHFNGASWSAITPPPRAGNTYYSKVWSVGPSAAFVVGVPGRVSFWDGNDLTDMTSGTTSALTGVWGVSETEMFAVTAQGDFRRYNGTSWSAIPNSQSSIRGVFGFAGNDVLIFGNNVTQFDGAEYDVLLDGEAALFGFWASAPDNALILGRNTFRYDGEKATPEDLGGVVVPTLRAAWGPPDNIIAVGDDGAALLYDGSQWDAMTTNTAERLFGVWGSAADDVFAVGGAGAIVRFNGVAWGGMVSGTTATLLDVWGTGPDNVYAVGGDGVILRYDGVSWSPQASSSDTTLTSIIGFSETSIYVTTGDTPLIGDGVTWTPTPLEIDGVPQRLFTLSGTTPENLFITIADDTSSRFGFYDGVSFTPLPEVEFAGGALATQPRDVFCRASGFDTRIFRYFVP
ncbi:MAG: hypothetical protein JRD92_17005 [Deltaproteobacteria bacterium]|nr:hypothetical protein [Deltaproteobacteria bacterium]MBW1906783.1 hypothetical protein [Deltaproteobacteria bacterium]MBW2161460.1 hypothetical protein [Deltaproteobacteria bacterium]MBW2380716.1 hypothetical protein [Deltaproteobacteria bacterium]MBW2588616.1 hypothetical protein [Deltaproteobacteria bacterium]